MYQMWGITTQIYTHLAMGLQTHTHTLSEKWLRTQAACKIRKETTKAAKVTHPVSHSQTKALEQTLNRKCQACGKRLLQNNESYTETSLLDPLNVSV